MWLLFCGSSSHVFLMCGITALTSDFYQNTHKMALLPLVATNFLNLDKKIFLMIIIRIYINKNYHSFHLWGVVNKTIQFFQNEKPCSQSNTTTPNPTSPHFPTFLFPLPFLFPHFPFFIFYISSLHSFLILFSPYQFSPLYFFILYISFLLFLLDFDFYL